MSTLLLILVSLPSSDSRSNDHLLILEVTHENQKKGRHSSEEGTLAWVTRIRRRYILVSLPSSDSRESPRHSNSYTKYVDPRNPPPSGGVFFLGGLQIKIPEQEDPPWKTTPQNVCVCVCVFVFVCVCAREREKEKQLPKIVWGLFFGVLFLRAVHEESTQKEECVAVRCSVLQCCFWKTTP